MSPANDDQDGCCGMGGSRSRSVRSVALAVSELERGCRFAI